MAAPAFVPRLFGAGMASGLLLALVLATAPDPQPPEAHIEFGSWPLPADHATVDTGLGVALDSIPPSNDTVSPAWMSADAQNWPHGMVMGRTARPVDRMDAEVVADWLSGFFRWLASRAA